jgi:hypothetical protein
LCGSEQREEIGSQQQRRPGAVVAEELARDALPWPTTWDDDVRVVAQRRGVQALERLGVEPVVVSTKSTWSPRARSRPMFRGRAGPARVRDVDDRHVLVLGRQGVEPLARAVRRSRRRRRSSPCRPGGIVWASSDAMQGRCAGRVVDRTTTLTFSAILHWVAGRPG